VPFDQAFVAVNASKTDAWCQRHHEELEILGIRKSIKRNLIQEARVKVPGSCADLACYLLYTTKPLGLLATGEVAKQVERLRCFIGNAEKKTRQGYNFVPDLRKLFHQIHHLDCRRRRIQALIA
jgi:hypothetical protein